MFKYQKNNLKSFVFTTCHDKVSENQVFRSQVAKTQQPDAEGFKNSSDSYKSYEQLTFQENFGL